MIARVWRRSSIPRANSRCRKSSHTGRIRSSCRGTVSFTVSTHSTSPVLRGHSKVRFFVCALKRRAGRIRAPWLRGISRGARSRLHSASPRGLALDRCEVSHPQGARKAWAQSHPSSLIDRTRGPLSSAGSSGASLAPLSGDGSGIASSTSSHCASGSW